MLSQEEYKKTIDKNIIIELNKLASSIAAKMLIDGKHGDSIIMDGIVRLHGWELRRQICECEDNIKAYESMFYLYLGEDGNLYEREEEAFYLKEYHYKEEKWWNTAKTLTMEYDFELWDIENRWKWGAGYYGPFGSGVRERLLSKSNPSTLDAIGPDSGFGNGKGIAQDQAKAVEWYTKAANKGNVYAQRELDKIKSAFNKKKLMFIILPLLLLISISIGIYFYNHPTKSFSSTAATSKPIRLDSDKTKSLVVYLDELSVLSNKYDKIYSENDKAAGECSDGGDDEGYTNYMNNIISSEKEYYNQLESLNVPPEAQDLHNINLERLQIFINYLPYQINFHFDESTKDIRDSKYEIYKQKKMEVYNEYERVKNKFGIKTDFETVFSMKIPQ